MIYLIRYLITNLRGTTPLHKHVPPTSRSSYLPQNNTQNAKSSKVCLISQHTIEYC